LAALSRLSSHPRCSDMDPSAKDSGGCYGGSSGSRCRARSEGAAGGSGGDVEEARRRQWRAMAQQGLSVFFAEQPEVFQRRARRGIPVEHRWQAWKASMRLEDRARPGFYQELLQVENQWTRLIEIDIPRTFPEIPLFDKEQQYSLHRVLNAFANLDPSVGYCQGMNFVAGLLLLVAQNGDFRESPRFEKEEEAFWMLACLMSDGRLGGFYRRHFPLLRRYLWAFDQLVAEHLPDLQAHFTSENVQHAVYLHQWFLTLFINCLPMPMVLAFWDAMVCGGTGAEVILPITVSLLQVLQNVLLSLPFEDIVRFFKTMRNGEQHTDGALIGRLVVAKCGAIQMPEHVLERLRAPLPEDDLGGASPPASPTPGGEEFICSPTQHRTNSDSGGAGDNAAGGGNRSVAAAFGSSSAFSAASAAFEWATPDGGPSLLGSYWRQFSEMGRDLPQGVRNWWEDTRGNWQHRVGMGGSQVVAGKSAGQEHHEF